MKHEKLVLIAIFTCTLGYCAALGFIRLHALDSEVAQVSRTSQSVPTNCQVGSCVAERAESVELKQWRDSTELIDERVSSSAPGKLDVQECAHSLEEENNSLLIQEPLRRSVLRPDMSSGLRNSNFRSNYFMMQAFKEALEDCWQCTVQIYCDDEQCAYGTVIDQDGWVITKASELDREREIFCVLSDQRESRAEVVSTLPELDLALLRIPVNGLSTVKWEYSVPDQGKWLATTDCSSELPAAIGVVSAGPSRIPDQKAVLGVELAPDEVRGKAGAKIKHVLGGSGADLAGLKEEDVISSLNGSPIRSRDELLTLLKGGRGGQFLNLQVHRQDDVLERRVRLMDLSYELLQETEMEVNGPISARSTGFQRVFMHDTVLQPNQCGGPVVNLDGRVVGINIARAGRVSTYAIPADTVRPAVQTVLEQAKLVSRSVPKAEQQFAAEIDSSTSGSTQVDAAKTGQSPISADRSNPTQNIPGTPFDTAP